MPWSVVAYVAEHLGVEDPSVVKRYTERQMTAYEHAWEIRDAYGYHQFEDPAWGRRFRTFLHGRAWTHAEGSVALFNQAVGCLAHGTLEVCRGLLRHTLYLEELTHQLTADWLTYRHRRWPTSTNPHLLVTQKTAPDPDQPPVSPGTLHLVPPKGLTLSGLRQDRILDEAAETADPLRLMRLFGIAEQTAMRYINAAHPASAVVRAPSRQSCSAARSIRSRWRRFSVSASPPTMSWMRAKLPPTPTARSCSSSPTITTFVPVWRAC
nr:DUF4158 domain-containing protein [Streptomyces sp. NRRL F-5755]